MLLALSCMYVMYCLFFIVHRSYESNTKSNPRLKRKKLMTQYRRKNLTLEQYMKSIGALSIGTDKRVTQQDPEFSSSSSSSDSNSSNSSNSQILASVHQRSLPEPSTPLPNLRQSIGGRTLYTLN